MCPQRAPGLRQWPADGEDDSKVVSRCLGPSGEAVGNPFGHYQVKLSLPEWEPKIAELRPAAVVLENPKRRLPKRHLQGKLFGDTGTAVGDSVPAA
jgi:hypothetical protein